MENHELKYEWLNEFDNEMVHFAEQSELLTGDAHNLWVHQGDKILMYQKKGRVFAFNFNPTRSFGGYFMPVRTEGDYRVVLSTDDPEVGGQGRISREVV